MKFLRAICRVIVGIVFIVSGFLKAADPVGTALKINEYSSAYQIGSLGHIAIFAGILLCTFEFLIGVSVLKGIKFKFFSWAALCFSSVFMIVTFLSAQFGLVKDCGCFGDVIHLTAWQTFYKNLVLVPCCILLVVQRKKFVPIANNFWEIVYISGYSLFIIINSSYSLKHLPQADFTDFRAGTDLVAGNAEASDLKYNTVFIYSKNGKEIKFDINHLPDSTWQYVTSKTTLVKGNEKDAAGMTITLKDEKGNYVTDSVLKTRSAVVMMSVYNKDVINLTDLGKLKNLGDSLNYGRHRADFYLVSGLSPEQTHRMLEPIKTSVAEENQSNIFENSGNDKGFPFKILYTDYKTAITFNRSNGGVTYVKEGEVIQKWSISDVTNTKVVSALKKNSDMIAANAQIHSQLFLEISLVIILCMVVILRFISKTLYKTVKTGMDILEQ